MASPSRSTGSSALRRGRRSGPSRPRTACRRRDRRRRRPGPARVPLASGSTGQAVSASSASSTRSAAARSSTGVYRSSTVTAVLAFQKHMGCRVTAGSAPVAWRTSSALPLPGVQRDRPVRLQRRERDRQLGDRAGHRPSRGRGPARSWRPVTAGSRSATSAASTAGTSRPRDPRGRARRRRPADPRRAEPVHGGDELPLSPRTTAPRPGRSSRRSAGWRPAT